MTLFSLLLVMALERVSTKSKAFHIATLAQQYFNFLIGKHWFKQPIGAVGIIGVAFIPSFIAFLLVLWLPALLVFLLNLLVLWVCLGCPVTRQTYKRYLQAAHKEDFQACVLHSMSFGNEGGQLSSVGKQLVLVNYRQYASVVIFFILLGIPGVIFYSLIKEWVLFEKRNNKPPIDDNLDMAFSESAVVNNVSADVTPVSDQDTTAATILFVLDWIPVRLTTFGFLIVGHFSNALSAWFDTVLNPRISTYEALAKVSKAAEDVGDCDAHLNEPLQLVKLVKRNIVFILMTLSLMTMVGVVA